MHVLDFLEHHRASRLDKASRHVGDQVLLDGRMSHNESFVSEK